MSIPDSPTPGGTLTLPHFISRTLSPYHKLLKVAHVNAQSLHCHIDEFRCIFETTNFDVILICETWLKPSISDRAVELRGYNLFRNDRIHKGGGGVAAFVKSNFKTSIIFSSDTTQPNHPEFIFIDVCVNDTHILISVCYRAPHLGYLADYEHALLDLMPRYSHVVVMGDLNTDLLGPPTFNQTLLTNMLHSMNLTILPLNATHHTATSETWLDVMAVSDPDLVAHHGQVPAPGLSKHDLLFFVYKLHPQKTKAKFIQYRHFKAINHDEILLDAMSLPWQDIFMLSDVDDMVTQFNFLINCLLEHHAPLITKRFTKSPAPWITDRIRSMQKQRDTSFRKARRTKCPHDWSAYKRLRNQTQQQIRNAKIRYYHNSLSMNYNSTRILWSKIKELGIGKSNISAPINFDLNAINDYFVNVPIDLSVAQDYANDLLRTPLTRPLHQFSFSIVSESDVQKAINHTTSNAVGVDKISINFLKLTLPVTLPIVTYIFNCSLISSSFPTVWKSAIVCPIKKIPNPQTPSDLRPISILPALSKCLERIVHQQLSSYFEMHSIISNYQSGFRKSRSTTTALLKITDDIRQAMDKAHLTVLTLFDFSKAFDCVYHPLLLLKLKRYGISDGCIDWVRSYLSGRRQCVRAGDGVSEWRAVSRGVPQGSVLGPLLFSLYINDISTMIEHSFYHLYADDLQIYKHFPITDMDRTVLLVNEDIHSIAAWSQKHGLKLNELKTQTIVIGHPRLMSRVDVDSIPKLRLGDTSLNYCDKVKNLGIIMNRTLNWTAQTTITLNRIFAGIHCLKRYASYLPFKVKLMLVKSLVLPHFNYCDTVISDMSAGLSDRLQRAQNYCIKFIFNLQREDHVTPFYNQLSLLKLKQLRKYHILVLLHKILISKHPNYLSERFKFINEISTRNTRQGASLLSVPVHRTTLYNKSFTVTACHLWNSLPENIRILDESSRFGVEVKDLLLRDV